MDRTKLGQQLGPSFDVNVDHAPDKTMGRAVLDGTAVWGGATQQKAGPSAGTSTAPKGPGTTPGKSHDGDYVPTGQRTKEPMK